jgi:hypothetical protein
MRYLALVLLVAACTGGSEPAPAVDSPPQPGPCDAAPVDPCGLCTATQTCVHFDSESGFTSCTDYSMCVETTEVCPPGSCTPACEAAYCVDPYTCDPTATHRFTCTKP